MSEKNTVPTTEMHSAFVGEVCAIVEEGLSESSTPSCLDIEIWKSVSKLT